MGVVKELLQDIQIPQFYKVYNHMDETHIEDVAQAVRDALKREGTLDRIKPGTTVFDLKDIFSENVTIDTVGELISTGDSFHGSGASYYAVVEGDINCDGKVTPADYILLKQTLAGVYIPQGASYKAACMDDRQPKEENAQKIKEYHLTGRWD